MEEYDICIVGAGTWGSAVAYHLTLQNQKLRICLIGPEEPKDRSNATIFGSYFDEGRLTKPADQDVIWGDLAMRSIGRYRDLEKQSGIPFFEDVGYLFLGPPNILEEKKELYSALHLPFTELNQQQINMKFPFLAIKNKGVSGLYSNEQSGFINIRKQRLAHQKLAKQHGCVIISDIVESIQDSNSMHMLTTTTGKKIYSRRILLCTGCFTGFKKLLPTNVVPDMAITTERVILLEMSEHNACKMKSMPSIIYNTHHKCYMLPPIKYPDGKYYLKVGHGTWANKSLNSNNDIIHHFRTRGPSSVGFKLFQIMKKTMADFEILSIKYDTCVTSKTSTGYPYCDMVTKTLGILVGGNGYGAKSADEIGRMGANMIRKCCWDHHLPQSKFKIKFKPASIDSQL